MSNDPASLDRLHDIVEPPPVSWWPLAPGWYGLLAIAAVLVAWWGIRRWRQWRANAYRRAALGELKSAKTPAEISELLRRTALAVAPRSEVASLTGERWPEWLAGTVRESMPPKVKEQMAAAIYDPASEGADITTLRDYAETWIQRHQLSESDSRC
ncbi:DUF4381 domain-containing protein [Aeoliella sp.]|uniref:DUF4381 domain-containing protein n=1 Tax=Aeoliella sp. TaxID=2795800 RepID=UPI003CCC1988